MPRSRGSEVSQRQSPRVPLHLKSTACSEANGVVRHSVDRSPKVDDRRSPCSPLHEKKRGTRVADLETKLTQTQEELKKLKEQLDSAEAARREAEQELEETKKLIPIAAAKEEDSIPQEEITTTEEQLPEPEPEPEPVPAEESVSSPATDVFEVVPSSLIQTESIETDEADVSKEDGGEAVEKEEVETKTMIEEANREQEEEEVPLLPKSSAADTSELSDQLVRKGREIEALTAENEGLKKEAEEAKEDAAASRIKEEEMSVRLVKVEEELRESKKKGQRLEEQVEAAEGVKEALEAEMKRLRVQTEQWRKAAEAAAAVLSAGEDGNGRKVDERWGSNVGGYGGGVGFVGSPGMGGGETEEDGLGGGKRRGGGGGMRMFGELWKKKGQK